MPRSIIALVSLCCLLGLSTCGSPSPATETAESPPIRVVFVTGDEEYRSEESMPMLARLVEREFGAEVAVCFALDSAGFIDPNRADHIAGLEALDSADLMVIFTRFRALPATERNHISQYVESGRPIVGFRTSTHAFMYPDSTLEYWNNEWPTKVFGQQWITHHGHFSDGAHPLTAVAPDPATADHPILRGVDTFQAYSWLYHVDGGDWQLHGDSEPFLRGKSLRSKHEAEGRLDQFPITNPVAWTKTYTGDSGQTARVFFTTLGHPYDFKLAPMRKLALNGIAWALGETENIPDSGYDARLVGAYEPNNSGFGERYKQGMRPADFGF